MLFSQVIQIGGHVRIIGPGIKRSFRYRHHINTPFEAQAGVRIQFRHRTAGRQHGNIGFAPCQHLLRVLTDRDSHRTADPGHFAEILSYMCFTDGAGDLHAFLNQVAGYQPAHVAGAE